MVENKFFLLLINFLWMAGLFGVLFALLYMIQQRRKQWWRTGYSYQTPRTLAPLYGALLLLVIGLALHAYATGQALGLGIAVVWALLALLFLYQWLEAVIDGLQEGWDTSLIEVGEDGRAVTGLSFSSGAAIALLVINVGLLSWWSVGQAQAGVLNFDTLVTLVQRGGASIQARPSANSTDNTNRAAPTLRPFSMQQAAATVTPTNTASATAIPTVTATAIVTVTPLVTATATVSTSFPSTPTATVTPSPTLDPTATAPPTATATPRPTKPPTIPATITPTATPTLVAGRIEPVSPLDNEASNSQLVFEWQANFTPSAGYAFELIFWKPDQDPMRHGYGIAAPTLTTSARVDLQRLDNDLGGRLEPATYRWGVLLVRTTPAYERIRYLGGGRNFTYYR